jgi:hypothetical protein
MIYLNVNSDEWRKRWRLRDEDYVCPKCGGAFKMELPFKTRDSVGLESREHGCGLEYRATVSRIVSPEVERKWTAIY